MPDLKLRTTTLTKRQWAMIAALGIVLIGAIAWPDGDAAVDAGADLAAPRGAAGLRPRARPTPAAKAKPWPTADLGTALRYDPFSSPLLTPPSVAAGGDEAPTTSAEQAADLLALQQDGVSMIVRDEAGMVATVGDRKLRVGDMIDGYRVVVIEMDGVVLERVKSE